MIIAAESPRGRGRRGRRPSGARRPRARGRGRGRVLTPVLHGCHGRGCTVLELMISARDRPADDRPMIGCRIGAGAAGAH